MITLYTLTLRNFLSYGNNTTTINLNFEEPTLIVGKNYDSMVNGQVDSNGAGKSAILNAISFCLYDKTISNIDKNGLINYINGKNMEVSLTFKKDNTYYKVLRYRKNKQLGGDGIKIFQNEKEPVFEEQHEKTPDSISNANKMLENILGIPFEIFSRVVIFSATYEPFFSLPTSHTSKANQKDIIEEIFGLTELSRKAEALKEVISATKSQINAVASRNEMLQKNIDTYKSHLDRTLEKYNEWEIRNREKIKTIKSELKMWASIDLDSIEKLINSLSKLNERYDELVSTKRDISNDLSAKESSNKKNESWEEDRIQNIEKIEDKLSKLKSLDLDKLKKVAEDKERLSKLINDLEDETKRLNKDYKSITLNINKLNSEILSLSENVCPYCKQPFSDHEEHIKQIREDLERLLKEESELSKIIKEKQEEIFSLNGEYEEINKIQMPSNIKTLEKEIIELETRLNSLKISTNPYEKYDTFSLYNKLMEVNIEIEETQSKIESIKNEIYSYGELTREVIKKFDISEVEKIRNNINVLANKLSEKSENPFSETIEEIKQIIDGLEKPDEEKLISLKDDLDHQNFLYKLLTKKDSFVRKALLNKNLPFLNSRMSHYLESMGLPHKVIFMEDMTAKITHFGTEYEYDNLSSGQKARLNLAISFAFRDVLQARFTKVNFCILDECLDVGLGNVGVQMAAKIIKNTAKEQNLSIYVISHRDEIMNMFKNRMIIELKNGFSNIINE